MNKNYLILRNENVFMMQNQVIWKVKLTFFRKVCNQG